MTNPLIARVEQVGSVLDDALERLRGMGPEAVHGAPNHGPMAAEALVALGCPDDVPRWVDDYRRELAPMPHARSPVTEDTWHEALGAIHRIGDWQTFFVARLAEAPWQTVLGQWMPRLVRGVMAGGSHSLIRTAHAVRALSEAETPLRVEEFASALAYWAAYYQTLPGVPRLRGSLDLDRAIEQIPRIGRDQRNESRREGVPREFVRMLTEYPDFAEAVDRFGTLEEVDASLSRLTETGARLYLAHASTHPLVFIHALTGPAAVRLLLPHMPAGLPEVALAYCWQAIAAWVAAYGSDVPSTPDDSAPPSEPEIIGRALGTRDHHAIKFAEACLREYRSNPQPVYLKVALDWPLRLRASSRWSVAERVRAGIAIGWDPIERQAIASERR
jgi:Questin oxidase-like